MLSGLSINLSKSSLYLLGVDDQIQDTIQQQLGFQQQDLPVKYLGVPLIITRLTLRDCLPLVERIQARFKLLDHFIHSPILQNQKTGKRSSCLPMERYIPKHHKGQGSVDIYMLPQKRGGTDV